MKLPAETFYLFGMGSRPKLLYQRGVLSWLFGREVLQSWEVRTEKLWPAEYRVELDLAGGGKVTIWEDSRGIWLRENDRLEKLGSGPLNLPRFENYSHPELLRRLLQEILINIVEGEPLPNLLVYSRPWYRDAAMIAICLEKTGNLALITPWISGLREPYDRNNSGNCEPDNLGQVLYLISLTSKLDHPLFPWVREELARITVNGHLTGLTDYNQHPVYQTLWARFGLRSLGLDDSGLVIPQIEDSYASLFWLDRPPTPPAGPGFDPSLIDLYPYLGWAEAHFYLSEPPPLPEEPDSYPLTWEAQASEADYSKMGAISPKFVARRIAAPHNWHAAEAFLYLLEK